MADDIPMFPLGSVLVPSMVLPLQLFEPRYLELARVCTSGRPEFGVVLIERGSEVGGGDVRRDVGCIARIVEATELADGRWLLTTVGTERIRVVQWLPDAPYPRAEVEAWPDPAAGPGAAEHAVGVASKLRRVLAMAAELGLSVPPAASVEVDDDPVVAGHQLTVLSPLGPADRYRLLAAESPDERLAGLDALLDDEVEVLARRLAGG